MWVLVRTKSAILYFAIVWLWNFLVKKDDHYLGRKRVLEMSNPSLTSEQKVRRMHSASVFCFKLSFGEPSQCLINHVANRTMCVKQTAVGRQPLIDQLLCVSEPVCAALWTFLFVWYDTLASSGVFRNETIWNHWAEPWSRFGACLLGLVDCRRRQHTKSLCRSALLVRSCSTSFTMIEITFFSQTSSLLKKCYLKSWKAEQLIQANVGEKSLQKQLTWTTGVHRKRRAVCHRPRRNFLSTSPGQWQSCQLTSWDRVMGYWDRVLSNPEQYSTLKSYCSKRCCRELSLARHFTRDDPSQTSSTLLQACTARGEERCTSRDQLQTLQLVLYGHTRIEKKLQFVT